MPRLDASRLGAWRGLQGLVGEVERAVDEQLRHEWDITLGWFDVLASLQRAGGRSRPSDIAADLRLPHSSVTRRLDRLEEEGWIARHRFIAGRDRRAVEIELTRTGRRLWREMNVSYRRAVQECFAVHLDDDEIASLHHITDILTVTPPPADPPTPDTLL